MKAKQILVCAAIYLAVAVFSVTCQPAEDKVDLTKIPLWPQEARGLNIYSQALAMPGGNRSIHYVYVECQNKTGDHPLILFLNGGPGMSSMLAFAKEIGPVLVEDGEEVWGNGLNQYAWSQFAHLLFFDSPAGVGFSIADPNPKAVFNDNKTATDAYEALRGFYSKFKGLYTVPLYIAGEQYGGVFAPWLAKTIIDKRDPEMPDIKLRGLMLGNAIVNPPLLDTHYYEFLYGHQLLNLDTWEVIQQACAIDQNAPRCLFGKKKVDASFSNMNMQDIYRYCYSLAPEPIPEQLPFHRRRPYFKDGKLGEGKYDCVDAERLAKVLNKREFQDAFHVPSGSLLMNKWFLYNSTIMNNYQAHPNGSYAIMEELFSTQKLRILIYHGDSDAEVPLSSVEAWLQGLGLEQHPAEPWEAWGYDQQTDGFVTQYQNNVTFATIRGVGQSAPGWARAETSYLVQRWLNNQKISE